jgi:predicted lipid-binding transport protein (Tim44 family)
MAKGGQRAKAAATAMAGAWRLFDAGDKVAARRAAAAVLQSPPSPQDADEARELLERVFTYFALLSAGLLLALVALAAVRG